MSKSIDEQIEEVVGTFIALKYDAETEEYTDGTLERWQNMLSGIKSLISQAEKEARIDERHRANHDLAQLDKVHSLPSDDPKLLWHQGYSEAQIDITKLNDDRLDTLRGEE